MSLSLDLIVPGAGPMLEALSIIGDLCGDMKEARQMCKRLQTRLQVAYNELHKLEFLPADIVEKYVDVAAKYLQFLQLYHGKQLVYRVVENSTQMFELGQIYEEVAELFDLAGFAFSNWGDEWHEDHRVLKNVLAATVEDSASVLGELQTSRARAEARWTLKFEIERRGERHDNDVMRLMKSMLTNVILASSTMDERLPDWFLPLYEVGFESNPFACGSFGAVHRGVWRDRTQVAIKFFLVDDEEIDERAQRHLEMEFSLLIALKHTSIMSVFGASHVSPRPFLVYELATNGNLGTFLAHSDGNKNRIWRLLHEAALGLAHLHSNDIVHGDLKLSNILIDAGMHARLSDFGLSTMRACSIRSRTNQRATYASGLRWRAPECLKRQPTRASDVYSFAMCIIEAANGEPPFAFLSDDDVRDNVRKGEIPEKPEAMTDEMWELVLAMTRLDPAKRVGLNPVLDKLKYFAELEVADKLKALEDAHKVAPMALNDDTRRTSVPVLVNAISSARGEELEESLLCLVVECVEDEQQSQLYEANSVLILAELFDSNLTKPEFELLGNGIREMTAQELADLKCILRDGNDQDKLKAAVYCAGAGVISKGEELQDSELCSLFVALLRNGTDVLKLWATIAVGKLATNDTNRSNFANVGAIASLFVLLQSGTATQKLWAAYALANVCQDNGTNSVATANCGAISHLMALLQQGTERQKEFAALALGQLALASDNSCVMISSAGAIAPLVSLLRSGNGKQKERAGFALGGLMSRCVENCTALEVEGGVELLISLLINGSDDQKEAAAFALGTFMARGDVKGNATELEQAVSYLVSLLDAGSDTQKELAALTLGTFSVGTDVNALAVAMERAVAPLANLLRDGLNGPREQAAFALSRFAGMNEASRAAIARAGSIPVLISFLQDGTDALKEHAVLCLGNLALTNTPNGAEIARAGAIPLFIALL
ncbi:Leucine-rich repeat serine/threonine-protein kinase 2 [Phytophthora pseudosyringae]|uniref:Leucine-rich repeat serine/threonine-protein kinase 2 n=1 Tax=Phytophthora pseudosyringae TaxID=221518 RepID=A0A8T1VUP7_9STRA|nr:Leucine-rich repeat serine/threonine-protein kinase 2 [Phytophthora pseudosyringae]